jgi:hypothetical protein
MHQIVIKPKAIGKVKDVADFIAIPINVYVTGDIKFVFHFGISFSKA